MAHSSRPPGPRRPESPRRSIRRSIGLGDSAQLAGHRQRIASRGAKHAGSGRPRYHRRSGSKARCRSSTALSPSNVTHIYQVTANRAGSFTIPAIAAAGAGSTQPIAFRVDKGAGGQSPARAFAKPARNLQRPASAGMTRPPWMRKASPRFSAWCCRSRNSRSANSCPWK